MSNNNDIITLTSADGTSTDFYNLGVIRHKGTSFAILQPVDLPAGMTADEALVFRMTFKAGGDIDYNIEVNDKIVDAVLKKFNNLVDQSNNDAGRAVGHPLNMLLDVGVFIVLVIMTLVVQDFLPTDGLRSILLTTILAGMVADVGYFIVHLFCFLIGKR
ncbi:MAG: DUF1292 domain-containing protein [Clostridia bacterium]|nr:DUF1292 domain-containing protein [Clostridia bacterium]